MRTRTAIAALTGCLLASHIAACSSPPSRAKDELLARLHEPDDPVDFVMTYRSGGTTVLDCVLPNRSFVITVAGSSVEARAASRGDVLATRAGEDLRLSPALFEPGPLGNRWLSIDLGQATTSERRRLLELLGPDLASYLLIVELPPSGEQTARAAVDASMSASRLGRDEIAGRSVEGFRLELDPQLYESAAPSTSPPDADAPVPLIDVWMDDDDAVARVTVNPPAGSQTSGWVIDFEALEDGSLAPLADPTVAASEISLEVLSPAPDECEL